MLSRAEHLELLEQPLFPDWPSEVNSSDDYTDEEAGAEAEIMDPAAGDLSVDGRGDDELESEEDDWIDDDDDSTDGHSDSESQSSFTPTVTAAREAAEKKRRKKWEKSLKQNPDWVTEHLIYSTSHRRDSKILFDLVLGSDNHSDDIRNQVQWNRLYAIPDTNCAVRGSLLHHCVYHKRYDLVSRMINEDKVNVNLGIDICEKRKREAHTKKKNRYSRSSRASTTLTLTKSSSKCGLFSGESFPSAAEAGSSSLSTSSTTTTMRSSRPQSSALTSIPSSEPVETEELSQTSLMLSLSASDSSREQSPTAGGYSSSVSSSATSSTSASGTIGSSSMTSAGGSSTSSTWLSAGPSGMSSRSSSVGPLISPTATMSPRSPLPCVMTCDIVDCEIRCQKSEPEEPEMRTSMISVADKWHSFSKDDTVLHLAIKMKDVRMVSLLLQSQRMNVRSVNCNNNTPVLTSIICGKKEIFDSILNRLTFSCGKDLSFAELLRSYLCNIWDHYRKTGSIDLSPVSPSRRVC